MSKDSLLTFLIFARKISNATSDNFLRNRRAILGLRWVAVKLIEKYEKSLRYFSRSAQS